MPNSYEHSYQHDLDNVIDASDAVLAIGTEKVNTNTLKDKSLNNNDGIICGAMPSNEYFFGRRYDGADDEINLGINTNFNLGEAENEDFRLIAIAKHNSTGASKTIYNSGTGFPSAFNLYVSSANSIGSDIRDKDANATFKSFCPIQSEKYNVLELKFIDYIFTMFIDGIQCGTQADIGTWLKSSSGDASIGRALSPFDGIISYSMITSDITTDIFNTLASLSLYSHNFTQYPNSDTSLTTVFPYTSGIITSGSFNKTDGLKCTAAGTIVFSNNFEFDGSEYITLTIDGVEYSGTTTVTQGTITATVAQGSNDITIEMGIGDVLPEIRVQFREEV